MSKKSYLISTIPVTSKDIHVHIYEITHIDIMKEPQTDKMYLKYHTMFGMFDTSYAFASVSLEGSVNFQFSDSHQLPNECLLL